MAKKKMYKVKVTRTRRITESGVVEIFANSPNQAVELASEQKDPDMLTKADSITEVSYDVIT